ncbi:MAG: hypothetical protein CME67_08065 [Halobacteriovoraceae bacterium]|nr:hypothetical protein [Halobacteriovoraceae bacterium]
MTHIELISSGCTANTIKFEDPHEVYKTMMKTIFYTTILLLLISCNNSTMLSVSNWAIAIAALVGSLGGIGKLYYSNAIKKEQQKPTNSKIHEINPEYKEWMLNKDSPIILELINLQLNFGFKAQLNKGDQINFKKFLDWDIDGEKPFLHFKEKWDSGKISLDNNSGVLPITGKKFLVKNVNKHWVYRDLDDMIITYNIITKYILTNTNALPSSKTINDFQTKKVKRIFNEKDLAQFDLKGKKVFSSKDEIPEQSGETLHFRLRPTMKPIQ